MKLIIIYGPPAAGKLTVAKELSKLTGYKVLHNHLAIDFVQSVFKINKGNFWDYVNKIRLDMIKIIVKEKINVIITLGRIRQFPKPLKDIVGIVRKNKGELYFVQLLPCKSELLKRVTHPERKKHGKIKNVSTLKNIIKNYDFYSPVPYKPNLSIDNSKLSAKKVALMIKKHYRL